MAEGRTEGYVSILVANLGYRNTTEGQAALRQTFTESSAGILTVQEANEHVPPLDWLLEKNIHYVKADGLGDSMVGIGIRDSLGQVLSHKDLTLKVGRYEGKDCFNCLLVATLQLRRPFLGRDVLHVASVHVHRGVAKRAKGCSVAADSWWDHIAYNVVEFDPLILCGDFNQSAHTVAKELAAAGARMGYDIVAEALVFPDTWDGESECLAVYWVTTLHHPRPRAKSPFLDWWDPVRQLWGHGGHWPLLAILQPAGSKRARTPAGHAKQKARKARRYAESQWARSKKPSDWSWGSWSWDSWSWDQGSWDTTEPSTAWTRPLPHTDSEEEEEWHSADEGYSSDDWRRDDPKYRCDDDLDDLEKPPEEWVDDWMLQWQEDVNRIESEEERQKVALRSRASLLADATRDYASYRASAAESDKKAPPHLRRGQAAGSSTDTAAPIVFPPPVPPPPRYPPPPKRLPPVPDGQADRAYYVANPTVVFYKRDDRTKRETHSAPPSARPHSKLCGPRQDQA